MGHVVRADGSTSEPGWADVPAERLTAVDSIGSGGIEQVTAPQLDAVLASMPVGLCFCDRDLRLVRINDTLANRNGLDRAAVVGRPLQEIIPRESYDQFAPRIREVFRTGRNSETVSLEAAPLGASDQRRHWLVTFYPIRARSDEVIEVGLVSVDITDEVRARHELARTVEYNETFTAMLGHDLRNPLNAITTAAQLLQRRATIPEIARPATRIVLSAERMSRMISQLLDVAHARVAGGLRLSPRPLDLTELCQLVLDELRQAYPEPRIELTATGSLHGRWDGDRLAQVVSNLAGNALEHGDLRAPVYVQLDGREPTRVAIRVENRGEIRQDVLPTLFEPFRVKHQRHENARGLGLGLYISKEIITAHGGTIDVRSTAEDGTCFEIELPKYTQGAP